MRPAPTRFRDTYPVDVAGETVELPLVPIAERQAIALLVTVDRGVRFGEHVGRALAERTAPLEPQVVLGAATLGIPVAIEVSRALGLDRYVILQKSPKIHLADALSASVESITSHGQQRLLLDRRHLGELAGKRTLLVDDVVATGASLAAGLRLARQAGALVVGIGVILTEAAAWRAVLGQDAALVHSLGHIPSFVASEDGWAPVPDAE